MDETEIPSLLELTQYYAERNRNIFGEVREKMNETEKWELEEAGAGQRFPRSLHGPKESPRQPTYPSGETTLITLTPKPPEERPFCLQEKSQAQKFEESRPHSNEIATDTPPSSPQSQYQLPRLRTSQIPDKAAQENLPTSQQEEIQKAQKRYRAMREKMAQRLKKEMDLTWAQ